MSTDNFRRRRLSTTEGVKNMGLNDGESPGGKRGRRLSMSPEMGGQSTSPFPELIVGTFSCHGVEPGNRAGETHNKINQDRGCMAYPFGPDGAYALFCVYDGHGGNGDKASQFAADGVAQVLEEALLNGIDEATALKKAFVETDEALKMSPTDCELSGTTAVAVLYKFLPDNKAKAKMWAANAGDSRAIMESVAGSKTKVADLTEDQKPNTPAEQARITKAGGYVSPPEEEWGGPARVWLDANMTLPGLAMARSIGDHLVAKVGVIAEPVVTTFDVDTSKDIQIVMASDGVWEFIESDQAMTVLNKAQTTLKAPDATKEVTKLIETAAAKWREEEGDYRDDITAICVKLEKLHEHHAAQAAAGASGAGASS